MFNSSTQNINSTLRVGLIAGPNYAIINSFDSNGDLIGIFAIENTSSGVRVSTTSPNDGNNYTAGYTSDINFTNLYVTPNTSGDLHIVIDIESELNDQIYYSDTVYIQCPSSTQDYSEIEKIIGYFNILGEKCRIEPNRLILKRLNNGKIIKEIIVK